MNWTQYTHRNHFCECVRRGCLSWTQDNTLRGGITLLVGHGAKLATLNFSETMNWFEPSINWNVHYFINSVCRQNSKRTESKLKNSLNVCVGPSKGIIFIHILFLQRYSTWNQMSEMCDVNVIKFKNYIRSCNVYKRKQKKKFLNDWVKLVYSQFEIWMQFLGNEIESISEFNARFFLHIFSQLKWLRDNKKSKASTLEPVFAGSKRTLLRAEKKFMEIEKKRTQYYIHILHCQSKAQFHFNYNNNFYQQI